MRTRLACLAWAVAAVVPLCSVTVPNAPAPTSDPSLVVRFADGGSRHDGEDAVHDAGGRIVASIPSLGYDVVTSADLGRTRALLAIDERIAVVDANGIRTAAARPNDPSFADTLHCGQAYLEHVRIPQAWDVVKGTGNLDIAVLDTGFDLGHPDLDGRFVAGWDFVGDDDDPRVDTSWEPTHHATSVATLAAAETDNAIGSAGVAWNARIIPVRVLDDKAVGTDSDIAAGIAWATDHGAEIINMSLAGPHPSAVLEAAVAYAADAGVVVVAAAGNEGAEEPRYPAAYPSVLSVGAADDYGDPIPTSNRGPWVDVLAPGNAGFNVSREHHGCLAYNPDYPGLGDATSFSTAIVSGAAALVLTQHPDWSPAQVIRRIELTANDRGPAGFDDHSGHGLLDAYAAVAGPRANVAPVHAGDASEPNDVIDRATPVESGRPRSASIAPIGDEDWYRIAAPGPGRITVQATSEDLDLLGVAYSPERDRLGNERNVSDPWRCCSPQQIAVDAPGTYAVRIRSTPRTIDYLGPAHTGRYAVTLTWSSEPPTGFAEAELVVPPRGSEADVRTYPSAVAVADVTDDGLDDLLVATHHNRDPEYVYVYAQRNDHTLASPDRIAVPDGVTDMAPGDLDGDGDTDVAVSTDDGVDALVQDGGRLQHGGRIMSVDAPTGLAVADVAGSPDPEVLAEADHGGLVMGSRSGTSWSQRLIDDRGVSVAIRVADVTGDGLQDIVGGSRGDYFAWEPDIGTHIRTLVQTASGDFVRRDDELPLMGPFEQIPWIQDLELVDATGDGRLDVVATGSTHADGRFFLIPQRADGTWDVTPPVAPVAGLPYGAVTLADLDMDGSEEIVFQTSDRRDVTGVDVYRPAEGAPLDAHSSFVTDGYVLPKADGIAGDLDGDRRGDLAGIRYSEGATIAWQLGDTQGRAPLWVRDVTPSDNATDVSRTVTPKVRFQRDVDEVTIGSGVRLEDGQTRVTIAATSTYDASRHEVTLRPLAPLVAGRAYQVVVAGVRDEQDTMIGRHVTRFTVAPATVVADHASDFNGDGSDDVAIAAPAEDVVGAVNAGVVHVMYGSPNGVVGGGQLWQQGKNGMAGTAEAGDGFGSALAAADLNADGFDDLVVGAPGEDVGTRLDAGSIHILLGSRIGLRAPAGGSFTQDSPGVPDAAETGDRFGWSLASGRFDNVSGDDVAVGSVGESVNGMAAAGAIHVLRGGSNGLVATEALVYHLESKDVGLVAEPKDAFGFALAAGDLDGDGHDDLAVGVPGRDHQPLPRWTGDTPALRDDAGLVAVFKGSIVGLRASTTLRDIHSYWPDIDGIGAGDRFGSALAIADVGGRTPVDGYGDLIVGIPGTLARPYGAHTGQIGVIFSDHRGPGWNRQFIQPFPDFVPDDTPDIRFGAVLAAVEGNGVPATIAAGTPGTTVGTAERAGTARVYRGGIALSTDLLNLGIELYGIGHERTLHQNSAGLPDVAEAGDRFGGAVSLLDVDGDRTYDLVAGVPGEDAAGGVQVIRTPYAKTPLSVLLTQDSANVPDSEESGDAFGAILGR